MNSQITEQSLIDIGAILTREDAGIRSRMSWVFRHHYEFGDRKDAVLMELADAKAQLKRAINQVANQQETPMTTKLEFTEEELFAIGDALDAAAKRTADELKLSRAKPYTRALEAQQKRYETLHARFVRGVEPNAAA